MTVKILMMGRHPGTYVREHLKAVNPTNCRRHFIDYPTVYKRLGHNEFQSWVVRICSDYNVTALIIDAINGFYHFDQSTFSLLRDSGLVLVGTCFDNSTEHRFYINCYQQFDGVIVSSSQTRFGFDVLGIPSYLYWPVVPDPESRLSPSSSPRKYQCTFVGSLKANRRSLLRVLKDRGIDMEVFGSNTTGGRVGKDQYWALLQQSKITISFNRQNHHFSWSVLDPLKSKSAIPTLRNIEAGLAGALCLAEWVPEFDDMFPGFNDLAFGSPEELAEKIKFFLADDGLRQRRAAQYQARCLELHANKFVFGDLLSTIISSASFEERERRKIYRGGVNEEPLYRLGRGAFHLKMGRLFFSKYRFKLAAESLFRGLRELLALNIFVPAVFTVFLYSGSVSIFKKCSGHQCE